MIPLYYDIPYINSIQKMETPPILLTKLPEQQRRMSCTQLFTRLKQTSCRELKTSKMSRGHRTPIHANTNAKISLSNSKENLQYYEIMKTIQKTVKFDENKIASTYLLSLRKEYDKMSKVIRKQVEDINYKKKEVEVVKNKIRAWQVTIKDSDQRVQQLKNELQVITSKQQHQKMQTKILQNIITRMKQDQLRHKTAHQDHELKLKTIKKQLKQKQEQVLQYSAQVHKILEQMSEFSQEYKKNNKAREGKLQEFQHDIEEMLEHEKFQQNRRERTYELLSIQSNDILDAKNVVLRDVLMTNKVLDKLLQCKITEMLTRYQNLQTSYHLIKTQTNISDPQLLKNKFFSYSQTLQQITQTIRYYEQKQQSLTQKNKQLKQKEKELYIKKLEEEKIMVYCSEENCEEMDKLVREVLEKQAAGKKIRDWIDKIQDGLGIRKSGDVGSPSEQVRAICQYAINKLKEVKQMPKNGNKFQSPGIRLKKVVKQYSEQDDKIRRSQAQQVRSINLFECMNLNLERKQIKKNQFQIKVQPKTNPKQ